MKPFATLLTAALLIISTRYAFAETTAMASDPAINVSAEGVKKTVVFKHWKLNLDSPNKVGKISRGMFCSGSTDFVYDTRYDRLFLERVGAIFKEKSLALGYPKYGANDSAFADTSTTSADFLLGFTLLDMNQNICVDFKEVSGSGKLKLKAELFSNKLQKVVYSRDIEATFTAEKKIEVEAFVDAMIEKVLNVMFADPKYVDNFRDKTVIASDTPANVILVKNGAKPTNKMDKEANGVMSAVVTIETGGTSGSGFYIGRDGYVITNQHVVGNANYVKVRLANGYSVPGQIVRKDPARDVALIKTEIEPPTALFVRTTATRVGEEVFAVGSPFGAQLKNTVTRGILSGERTLNEQRFIQSDVSINPGSSGGPLVDAEGGLIAVADLKKQDASGIAMFIPIEEVLEKLGLKIQ